MTDRMTLQQLERFLIEINEQPHWRASANREADFYDGNQLDSETLALMEERGIPPLQINLIQPTINTILGMEAKTRLDWKVIGEGSDHDQDLADALTVKLMEAERVTRANRACADAYKGQVGVGIGWVGVHRATDPFGPRFKVDTPHRNEMYWDWRAREPDLGDARYLVRRKWYDEDFLTTMFPRYAGLIRDAVSGLPWWDSAHLNINTELARDLINGRDFALDPEEWLNPERRRAALYEVWYRVWVRGQVLALPGGRVVEFDRKNPMHQAAVMRGLVRPQVARYSKVRLAWWCGPLPLADVPSPYAHNKFPYVPFIGYREDLTGVPYGMIRSMMSPQEEINARRSKMMWLLSARRVLADKDAVDDHNRARQEVSRADAYIILNQERRNADGFKVDDNVDLSEQQFKVLEESKGNIQDASGMYQEFRGQTAGSSQSGKAIRSLVEQSVTTLGEINDNYRQSRQAVGDLLLTLMVEDLKGQDDIEVKIDRRFGAGQARTVMLNQRRMAEDHEIPPHDGYMRDNDLTRLRARVALEETPSSSTYREHYSEQLFDLVKTLPPEVQIPIIDIVVESTDLPNRHEIADRIRKMTGQVDDEDPQAKAAAQAQEQLKQRAQMADLAEREAAAEERKANARVKAAQVDETIAKTAKLRADTEHVEAQTDATDANTDRQDVETLQGPSGHEDDKRSAPA